jgi:predicted ATPase/DNA-binding SARP family transcriptional activator
VQVRVLGQVEVADGAEKVQIGSRSQRIVLATIAAAGGDTVSVERLVTGLWGDAPPRTAEQSLRTYISRLRKVVGDAIAIRPAGYALTLDPARVDALRFEALVRDADRATGEAAVALLDDALATWTGEPFGDVADAEPLVGTAVRLRELHAAAREQRAGALLAAGHAAEAVAAAEDLLAEQPLREAAWAVLVEALARTDRTADALRAYQRAVAALTEAGLEPSARLRDAEATALAGAPTPEPAPGPGRGRLPAPATSLVGRDTDLDHLARLLGSARLVTLTGPGGVGKTRLAIEVARRIADSDATEVRLVELAGITDPDLVASAVADELGLAVENETPLDALAGLGGLDLLVVLDNCEHVIDTAAAVANAIITGGDRARVLATSRERLAIHGEHTWAVAPLALAGPESPAHRLLIERAQAARPTLVVGDDDRATLDRIVRRLDGLPLAIEMAAARAATLPLAEIADRLDHQLNVLQESQRSRAPRHRTLAAVVEWSETLLDDDERALFAELSVFAGSATADDISVVAGRPDAFELLCRLSERSLITTDTTGDRARFRMLETIREHARARLAHTGRAHELAGSHAEYVLAAVRAADVGLRTPREAAAAQRIEELLPEARAAYQWARAHDLVLAAGLAAALHLFAQSRLRDELLSLAAQLASELPGDGVPGATAAVVLASAAARAVAVGDLAGALAFAERGVTVAGDAIERAYPLEIVGDVHTFVGRLAEADAVGRTVVDITRGSTDGHLVAIAMVMTALPAAYAGRYAETENLIADADIDAAALAPSDQAWLAYTEGEIVLDRDPERALAALTRAIALADSVGNRYVGGVARLSECSLRARAGDVGSALDAFGSVIRHWRRCGSNIHQLTTLRNFVVLLRRVGAAPEAAELLGAVRSFELRPTYGDEAARLDAADEWVRSELGDEDRARHSTTGAARSLDESVTEALAWIDRLRSSKLEA